MGTWSYILVAGLVWWLWQTKRILRQEFRAERALAKTATEELEKERARTKATIDEQRDLNRGYEGAMKEFRQWQIDNNEPIDKVPEGVEVPLMDGLVRTTNLLIELERKLGPGDETNGQH